jgi:hypothetical protein
MRSEGGRFGFLNLDPGTYQVATVLLGYRTDDAFVVVEALKYVTHSFRLERRELMEDGPVGLLAEAEADRGHLFGRILDDAGKPVPGVRLRLDGERLGETLTTSTNSRGEFWLLNLASGEYVLSSPSGRFTDNHTLLDGHSLGLWLRQHDNGDLIRFNGTVELMDEPVKDLQLAAEQ